MAPEDYMRIAINEALKGEGWTNPNPMVGAVIVKDGKIIGKDYHHKCGEYHAERNAILNCKEDMRGAELYVTLEPCCHYGKTPPCTEIIIENGIRKVYVGSMDKNPLVAGKGVEMLRAHGIEVVTGVLEEECRSMNQVFFHYMASGTPYVVMKYAMTADGKIATVTGASKWITGEASRGRVQRSRHKYMGIMVGLGTVLADDPSLTCRIEGGRNPIRIVCDTHLRTPFDSQVVQTAKNVRTIIATCSADQRQISAFEDMGCQVVVTGEYEGHVDLRELMKRLGDMGIDSILLEGGGSLNASAMAQGIVQKVESYIAPKLFGGDLAKSPIAGEGVLEPDLAYLLKNPKISRIEEDILIEWEVADCLRES
ncbi:MAG: bifunctional diaminohydroxyphosphoribosylaminopyrimidine deaminase/5-amino-6-(5-phosphoribosylamino)uracil reductase RibD [Lachnospiraceae bacterium]|nr:bifunctional diaminohydroxyphosphoribosylaminopyrimidine deaminase/5-amino-6-(5-phosphoribosylamino)uracil reductase RibD [Lachnospiraceae bacterium]MDE6982233.1 bifunctional diaminohydroxyphosphoribosylaminopyrimidine deaminase/5-amino-6-(5-phosphoribosylamino)uracil reductase RibD [Lachnospiraceae bacterium]